MSEKHLTELPWKALATKQRVKDGELTKALVAWGKADAKDPDAQLKSLDKILTTAEIVKRANKTDKEVAAYVEEIIKEARKNRAAATDAAAAPPEGEVEALESEGEDADDENAIDAEAEEYKQNYKSKLTAALSQVKGRAPQPGDPPKPQLRFVAMVAGKGSSVLVASNVGGPARKVLKSLAGGGSGAFVSGECIFEENAHTFVVQTIPGGLASKLSKALKAQTGIAYKVRVRTPDGSVVLDGDTDVDPDAADGGTATAGDPPAQTPEDEFKTLKSDILPQVKKLYEGDFPTRDDIIRMIREAMGLADSGDFPGAVSEIKKVGPLLKDGAKKKASRKQKATVAKEEEEEEEVVQREGESYADYLDRFMYQGKHRDMVEHMAICLREQLGDTGKMRAVMAFAEEKSASGNFRSALKALEALEKLVDAAVASTQAEDESYEDYLDRSSYQQTHAGLLENMQYALQQQLGDAGKMRAVMAFAEEKFAAGNFKSARKALEALEKLIDEAAASSHADENAPDDEFSKVEFEKIHLDWDSGKKAVEGKLAELRAAIVEEFDDPESLTATTSLQNVLARFNEGLGDTLDTLRNATDPAQRSQLVGTATGIADRYLEYLNGSPLVAHVEANPYDVAVAVRDTLTAPLDAVKMELAKLGT